VAAETLERILGQFLVDRETDQLYWIEFGDWYPTAMDLSTWGVTQGTYVGGWYAMMGGIRAR